MTRDVLQRWVVLGLVLVGGGVLVGCGGAPAAAPLDADLEADAEAALREASLSLVPPSCGGVVIDDAARGLTAAHCIAPGATRLDVRLSTGELVGADVAVDRENDLALLLFDEPVAVEPLQLADEPPAPGDTVFFLGNPGREGGAFQVAEIEAIGQCPTLPAVDDALFTTLEAEPGDSGAPLLDEDLEVVGLVHGGAQCEIAVPVGGVDEELR